MRKRVVGYLAVIIAVFAWYCFWPRQICDKVIDHIGQDDKKLLESFCVELLRYSGFGYTLFGDKPVSSVIFPVVPSETTSGLPTVYAQACLPLLKKYSHLFKLNKFIITCERQGKFYCVHFINKLAFRTVVEENYTLFRQVLGDVSAEAILERIYEGQSYSEILKNDEVLIGALYGFGINNARLFYRRSVLSHAVDQWGTPPWKTQEPPRPSEIDLSSLKGAVEASPPPCVSPTKPFLTPQEELSYLDQKVGSFSASLGPQVTLPRVFLPGFVADPNDEETHRLVEKYQQQRRLISQILSSGSPLETVLNKITEP